MKLFENCFHVKALLIQYYLEIKWMETFKLSHLFNEHFDFGIDIVLGSCFLYLNLTTSNWKARACMSLTNNFCAKFLFLYYKNLTFVLLATHDWMLLCQVLWEKFLFNYCYSTLPWISKLFPDYQINFAHHVNAMCLESCFVITLN